MRPAQLLDAWYPAVTPAPSILTTSEPRPRRTSPQSSTLRATHTIHDTAELGDTAGTRSLTVSKSRSGSPQLWTRRGVAELVDDVLRADGEAWRRAPASLEARRMQASGGKCRQWRHVVLEVGRSESRASQGMGDGKSGYCSNIGTREWQQPPLRQCCQWMEEGDFGRRRHNPRCVGPETVTIVAQPHSCWRCAVHSLASPTLICAISCILTPTLASSERLPGIVAIGKQISICDSLPLTA